MMGMAGWQSGYAEDCKSLYIGSIPVSASIPFQNHQQFDFHFQYIEELERFTIVERCSNIVYDYKNKTLLFSLTE